MQSHPAIAQLVSRVQALKQLAAKANNDVRSCLNTLQLLAARHDHVTAAAVHGAQVGQKDMTTAPFEVWQALLLRRKGRPADMFGYLAAFGEHAMVRAASHLPCGI